MWLGNDDQQPACAELFSAFKSIDQKFDELISYDQDEKIDRNVESKTVVFQKDKNSFKNEIIYSVEKYDETGNDSNIYNIIKLLDLGKK